MSDDIFKDIWQKLSSIYEKMRTVGTGENGDSSSDSLKGKISSLTDSISKLNGYLKTSLIYAFKNISLWISKAFSEGRSRAASIFSRGSSGVPAVFGNRGLPSNQVGGTNSVNIPGKIVLNPWLKLAAIGSTLFAAFVSLSRATYSVIKAQLEQQRELAKFNGVLARSFAISDFQDILREMRVGAGTASSTNTLNETFTSLKDSLVGLRVLWMNLTNKVLSILGKILAPVVKMASAIASAINSSLSVVFDGLGVILTESLAVLLGPLGPMFKTLVDQQKKKSDQDRIAQERAAAEKFSLPIEGLFRNILNRNWAAVHDTRRPLF